MLDNCRFIGRFVTNWYAMLSPLPNFKTGRGHTMPARRGKFVAYYRVSTDSRANPAPAFGAYPELIISAEIAGYACHRRDVNNATLVLYL
jgi:hypothetical protein